eukprot:TRINITY_DN32662_c0_g2_i1.p1 TRINITY_DN32662_c0_g2~~TRINITY_DN32662_c0_g2_i1.p1  ORF type:complete len:262 (+),score=92.56 TRINITY_DN32662_c0_g2_i1:100-885(+)
MPAGAAADATDAAAADVEEAELAALREKYARQTAPRSWRSQRPRQSGASCVQSSAAASIYDGDLEDGEDESIVERCDRMLAEEEPEVAQFRAELKACRERAAAEEAEREARQLQLDEQADRAERAELDRLRRLSDWEAAWQEHLENEQLHAERAARQKERRQELAQEEQFARLTVEEGWEQGLEVCGAHFTEAVAQRAHDEGWLERWLGEFDDRWQEGRQAAAVCSTAAMQVTELRKAQVAAELEAEQSRYHALRCKGGSP